MSWVLASITPSYLPQLVGCSSSHSIWTTIEQLFSSQCTAKVMFYKRQIQTLKKDSLSMRDFLMKMKGYFDMVSAADHGMTDTDQVLAILNGLGDEYESIIAIICSREIPYTLQHVNSLLLSHEGRILQKSSTDVVANYSNYPRRGSTWNGHQNQGGRNNNNNNRGRGRGRSYYNRPQCQLCGKLGHTVLKCYYRFDQNF
ncbi:hypothetical protein UlMin_041688 [Ulmus minor]